MKRGKKVLTVFLAVLLLLSTSMQILAADPAGEGTEPAPESAPAENERPELTEEERLQQELDAVYAMPVESNAIEGWPQGPGTYGEAAIVMEVETGAILYGKNIDEHYFPASITKVLTSLIALENGQLSDPVQFSNECVSSVKPDEASIGMKEGNQISLEQALYATLLASANEAAYAVGESVGKNAGYDYSWFIQQMNQRCQELGGANSNFVNANGVHDPNHYTCARDMALISREMFKHPEFFTIAQTHEYTIPASETTEEHIFQQHDKMLDPGDENYYEYVIGGKTGYTSDALSTLITMADNGSMQLVCVVLKTHGQNIYPDTRNLLEYAFSNFGKVMAADYESSEYVESIGNTQAADESAGTGTEGETAAPEGSPEGEGTPDGTVPEGSPEGEGTPDGAAAPEGSPEGEGTPDGTAAPEGSPEGEGTPDGTVPEGSTDGAVEADAGAMDTGTEENSNGYVILPNGVEFQDLDMEIIPDGDTGNTGTLEYRFSGNLMGSVRAVLSPSYLEEGIVKTRNGKADKDSDGPKIKNPFKKLIKKCKALIQSKTPMEKKILLLEGVILLILIIMFIVLLNRMKRHRRD